jgi:type II secretory pathway pseudopilin PulG
MSWAFTKSLPFQTMAIVAILLAIALGFQTWNVSGLKSERNAALERAGQERSRADLWAVSTQKQSESIAALAVATEQIQAAVIANGNASRGDWAKMQRALSPLLTRAASLASRLPGPPETACKRAAETIKDNTVSINWGEPDEK